MHLASAKTVAAVKLKFLSSRRDKKKKAVTAAKYKVPKTKHKQRRKQIEQHNQIWIKLKQDRKENTLDQEYRNNQIRTLEKQRHETGLPRCKHQPISRLGKQTQPEGEHTMTNNYLLSRIQSRPRNNNKNNKNKVGLSLLEIMSLPKQQRPSTSLSRLSQTKKSNGLKISETDKHSNRKQQNNLNKTWDERMIKDRYRFDQHLKKRSTTRLDYLLKYGIGHSFDRSHLLNSTKQIKIELDILEALDDGTSASDSENKLLHNRTVQRSTPAYVKQKVQMQRQVLDALLQETTQTLELMEKGVEPSLAPGNNRTKQLLTNLKNGVQRHRSRSINYQRKNLESIKLKQALYADPKTFFEYYK